MKSVMQFLVPYLAVGLAGSAGSILRYVVGTVSGRIFRTTFPVGTFIINITGSLFLGWFLARYRDAVSDTVRIGIAIGFVGAYTTFSTFMYESSALFEDGQGIKAMVNLVGSVVVGLVAVRAGIWLAMR